MTATTIERLRNDDWQALRDVRLAALEDAPHAFWARLADERVYGREKWISFLAAAAWFVTRRWDSPSPWPPGCRAERTRSRS